VRLRLNVGLYMEKYKLNLKIQWFIGKTKTQSITKSFIWEDKDDALACKALLEKSSYDRAKITVSFVAFTDEVKL